MAGHRLLLYCSALLTILSFALGAERRIEDAASAFQVFRIWDDYSMNVTGLPPESSETFKTVAMESFTALPEPCVLRHDLTPNMQDKGRPRNALSLWLGRLSDLFVNAGASLDIESCSCGLVLFSLGSGGATSKNNRYMRMLAALGYVVVAPDTMSNIPAENLRHKDAQTPIDAGVLSDYWSDSPLYQTDCSWPTPDTEDTGPQFPYCYSTKYQNVAGDAENWKRYYQRVFLLRSAEMDEVLLTLDELLGDKWPNKTFLLGQSEGAMIASRFHNPLLERRMTGRIISSWSCEYNYYVDSPESAEVCGGLCNTTTPVLNIIGTADEYFGVEDSVAANVSASPTGYGTKNLTGNCYSAFQDGGFSRASVLVVDGAAHDMSLTDDNLLRNVLASFVADPERFHENADGWTDMCTSATAAGQEPASSPILWKCSDSTDPLDFVFDGPNHAWACAAGGVGSPGSSGNFPGETSGQRAGFSGVRAAAAATAVIVSVLGLLLVWRQVRALRHEHGREGLRFSQLTEIPGPEEVTIVDDPAPDFIN